MSREERPRATSWKFTERSQPTIRLSAAPVTRSGPVRPLGFTELLLAPLRGREPHEGPVEQQIVRDLQRAGDEERQVDERGLCKQEAGEDRRQRRPGGR